MTLWILASAERSKIIILPIRDKKKKPLFVAELILRNTDAGPRPHKFKVKTDGESEFRPPSEFVDLIRIADRIMIAKDGNREQTASFAEMLTGFQLSADVVNACRFCLLKDRFNFLNRRSIKYHREKVCEDCAREELFRTLRSSHVNYSEDLCERFEEIMLKTRILTGHWQ
ncbi:MAG: hypothetical protein R2741_13130 [Methanolobus sp.]